MKETYKFTVRVQPFLQVIEVEGVIDGKKHSCSLEYTESDEWIGFDLGGRDFDLHILFDEELEVSIYDVVYNEEIGYNETETLHNHTVRLLLEIKQGKFLNYKTLRAVKQ